jgi:methylated-DNA-[protein]-cysteine S-methyltransferase
MNRIEHDPDATVHTTAMDTPIGVLTITVTDAGVRTVVFPAERDDATIPDGSTATAGATAPGAAGDGHPLAEAVVRQLAEYFDGERQDFDVPLDPVGTEFQLAAWRALCTIPYGETVSYGEQAARLGDPRKARAVGAANGRNPIPIIVPCHRVVGADGSLTGFGGGIETKAWLLAHEERHCGRALDLR